MADDLIRDPDLEWLEHAKPTGLVLSPTVIKERTLVPERQTQADTAQVAALLSADDEPALSDPWTFAEHILGWAARYVAGAPGGPDLPDNIAVTVPEHETTLVPDWAVRGFDGDVPWQLLVRLEPAGTDPDKRGEADGWEATPHQRFERLLRETGVLAGAIITDKELRLICAPRGETSGWVSFPLRSLATVAGRPMLAGLKLVLGSFRLFNAPAEQRLRALLKESREAQAAVSAALAEQVLGALHELLRGFSAAEHELIGRLAGDDPQHLYEGLLAVLMRLVFVLYAEDRDLIPSHTDAIARKLYDDGYSVCGLYAKLTEDAALNPDTMEERYGSWGRLLALFRLIHQGHRSGFVQARGGKLFDPDVFPFLEGRADKADAPRVPKITDGCLLSILEGLMTVREPKTRVRQRLSYRALDVEQIGSVYETVMGFTVQVAHGRVLAIRAGKNNRTPVFADLDQLATLKPTERPKYLKDACNRANLPAAVDRLLESAVDADSVAVALDAIVDERGSPGRTSLGAGTPLLQPTEERRRTGSHYTPRSLTEPIVRHALEPAFERCGDEVRPEVILDLKVCDPAMGSGAFLVEACRRIAERLVKSWARHPDRRPAIPADEDEELHARRLIAQRCLYGVDKNPMAVDLARLSLWLATLAREHEFTFLDHALKTGDSLVGLTRRQMRSANWDETKPGLPLLQGLIDERVEAALKGRGEIREAPDDITRAIQEVRHRTVEKRLEHARWIGDAVIAAFFAADKPKAREKKRQEVESWLQGGRPMWEQLEAMAASLGRGAPHEQIRPFHWEIEFPEVFVRDDPGFDAIVGNPPFAGKNTIAVSHRSGYGSWLQTLHEGAHGNADLVAHFFRRAFALLRRDGALGLMATKTIRQGDTRNSGLRPIRKAGGAIYNAKRRIRWPGEAAVVVSTVHICRGEPTGPVFLDDQEVHGITAFLFHEGSDDDPASLSANAKGAFKGVEIGSLGYLVRREEASWNKFVDLVRQDDLSPILKPYVGGRDVNAEAIFEPPRYVIDVDGLSLAQMDAMPEVLEFLRERVRADFLRRGEVDAETIEWWHFRRPSRGLRDAARTNNELLGVSRVSDTFALVRLPSNVIANSDLIIFSKSSPAVFCALQARVHETWARFFSSSMKDDLRYTPAKCFRNFPFPRDFAIYATLNTAGESYYAHRMQLMIERNEGLTRTYNRFHDRVERAGDIQRLRNLHAEMDRAVLRAYGWDDLAERAEPMFLDESNEPEFAYQGRLFWPSEFRDEVLACLLELNAERHAEDVRLGLVTSEGRLIHGAEEDDEAEIDESEDAA
jgi:N-6 DNA Methylase